MKEHSEDLERTFLSIENIVRCPKCSGSMKLDPVAERFTCINDSSHIFPLVDGIAKIVTREDIGPEDAQWVFGYDEKAEQYDEMIQKEADRLGIDMKKEYRDLLRRMPARPGCRIIDVSTGTGAVIFGIKEAYPDLLCGSVGTDLSIGMLRVARQKFKNAKMSVPLFHSQVTELPFEDQAFDVVTHFGGINTFKDIPAALKEWIRILRPDGYLLVADEGVSPALRKTRKGADIIKSNWLFGLEPPLKCLPPQVKNVELRWVVEDMFYAISCRKMPKEDLEAIEPLRYWFAVEG